MLNHLPLTRYTDTLRAKYRTGSEHAYVGILCRRKQCTVRVSAPTFAVARAPQCNDVELFSVHTVTPHRVFVSGTLARPLGCKKHRSEVKRERVLSFWSAREHPIIDRDLTRVERPQQPLGNLFGRPNHSSCGDRPTLVAGIDYTVSYHWKR